MGMWSPSGRVAGWIDKDDVMTSKRRLIIHAEDSQYRKDINAYDVGWHSSTSGTTMTPSKFRRGVRPQPKNAGFTTVEATYGQQERL